MSKKDDFQDATDAYNRQDYETAYKLILPLAEQGDADAQFKQILSDMKKGYDVINRGYNTIRNLSQGNFELHHVFIDGLLQVSPTVRKYKKVIEIITYQRSILKEYRRTYDGLSKGQFFNGNELAYLKNVYNRVLKESIQNLDELTTILTTNKLRMSDDERISAIDHIYTNMESKLEFIRYFNRQVKVLHKQRTHEKTDIEVLKSLY